MKNFKFNNQSFKLALLVSLAFASNRALAEGTKQLRPTSSDVGAVQIYDNNSVARSFATYSAPAEKRLYIHISVPANERIYMGFNQPQNDVYFRLKDPNGNIVMGPTLVPSSGNGFISNYAQAIAGPSALAAGGYNALSYQPLLAGDYYIEFSPQNPTTPVYIKRVFDLLDITVANKTTNTPILGRLWSKIWDLTTYSFANTFAAKYFIYSTDSLVTQVGFNGIKPYGFNIFCNQTGCANTGNLIADRKSRAGEYGIPEYKLFLNDPDNAAYPSGTTQNTTVNTSITGCQSTGYCINVSSNKMGSIEIMLDLNGVAGYQTGTADVLLGKTILPGVTCINWNGKDGLGNFVAVGTTFNSTTKFIGGLTNLPMFDVEGHPNGYTMSIVRPAAAAGTTPKLYWDDTNLSSGTSNYSGANSPAHAWLGNDQGAGFGDVRTMNTWWYSYDLLQTVAYTIKSTCPPTANNDNVTLCAGTSSTISILSNDAATVGSTINVGSVSIFQQPANGTVTVNSNGTVIYTPQANYSGSDSFIYNVKDSYGNTSNTATVAITVNPKPTATTTAGTITCKRDETSARLGVTTNIANATFAWSGNNFSSALQNPMVSLGGTYTVVVTNPTTGCATTATAVVNQNTLAPSAIATGGHINCANPAVGLTASSNTDGVNFNWTGPNGFSSLLKNPMASAAGTYTVVVVNPVNECFTSATAVVTGDFTAPNVSATGGHITCGRTSNTVIITASSATPAVSYSWNGPSNFSANTASDTVAVAGNYVVTVLNPVNGCSASATAVVTAPLAMNLTASVNHVLCNAASTGSALVNVSGGTAPFTYAWNTNPAQTSAQASNLSAGTYTVVVTDTDECPTSIAVTVNEPSALVATTSAIAPTCFNGNNASASVMVSGGNAPYSYTWNTAPAQYTANVIGLTSGSYAVTVKDANNCVAQANAVVPVTAPVDAEVTTNGATTFCDGGSVNLTAASGASYLWSNGATTQNITVTAAGAYSVTVMNAQGCSSVSTTTVVSVNPNPTATTTGGVVTCKRDETSATLGVTTNIANATFAWSGNNFSSALQNPMVSLGGTYTVVVTNPTTGCATTATAVVNQNTLAPSATATGGHINCANPAVGLTANSNTVGVNFNWTGPNGFASLQQNPSASAAGTYTVVVVNPVNECFTSATAVVTGDFIAPAATAIGGHITCGRTSNTVIISASSTTPAVSYSWNGPSNFSANTASDTVAVAGNYVVTVLNPVNGCSASATALVTAPVAMNLTASVNHVLCNAASTGSALVNVGGGTAPFTYAWNTNPAQTSAQASNLKAGTYTVVVTDADECPTSIAVTVNEPSALVATTSAIAPTCFNGNNASASVMVSGGNAPYSYTWNTAPAQYTANVIGLTSGSYAVTVKDANNCVAQANAVVPVTAPVDAEVTTNGATTFCDGGSVNLTAASGASYLWSNGATTQNITVTAAGAYSVTVMNAQGCSSVSTTTVVSVNPNPTATTTGGVVTCKRDETSATLGVTTNIANATFAWTGNNFSSALQNPMVSLGGTYTVVVTNPTTSCATTATAVVNQNTLAPSASATGGHINCANPSVGLTANSNTVGVNFNWTGPNGFASLQQNPSAAAAGTYTVVVVNPVNECFTSATAVVTADTSIPQVNAVGGHISCKREETTLVLSASVSVPVNAYSWSGPNGFASTNQNPVATIAGNYQVTVINPVNGCVASAIAVVTGPTSMGVTASKTASLCAGAANGSAIAQVNGGTAPFTFQWNTNPAQTTAQANQLAAGTYTVVVTDADECSVSTLVEITAPASLAAQSKVAIPVSCRGGNDGQASVGIIGGTAPYTYSWSTNPSQSSSTATGLKAGAYTVFVTDSNGCTDQYIVGVTQPAALSVNKTIIPVSCNGAANGSIIINGINGGTAPYTTVWNTSPVQNGNTLNNLAPGQYVLTVTDAKSCNLTMNYNITQPQVLGTKTNFTHLLCNGDNSGTATVTGVGGTAPYTYSWNTSPSQNTSSITGLSAGAYTCYITDARGCTVSKKVTISEPKGILVKSSSTPVTCRNEDDGVISIFVNGGTAPYSIIWNNGDTSSSITGLTPGTYTYVVTDALGCSKSGSITLEPCDSFGSTAPGENPVAVTLDNEVTSSIYPNPANDHAFVDVMVYNDTKLLVQVYQPDGLLLTTLFNGNAVSNTAYHFTLNANNLAPGVYLVHIQTSAMTLIRRLIVQ